MARGHCIGIRGRLQQLLPGSVVNRLARESGFIQRERKVQAKEFVWTLVLGFATGEERTLAGLHRAFLRVARKRISRSSFYERFTPSLVRLLRALLGWVIRKRVEGASVPLARLLARFEDVVVADSTVIRLREWLAKHFPACRTNHTKAAAKLYMVMGVKAAGPRTVKVKPERVHDRRLLRIGSWVAGRLLLIDLGFHCYRLFANVIQHKGFLLSRLKKNANPRIVRVLRRHRGQAIDLVAKSFAEIRKKLKRQVLDVEVELRFRRRRYRGKRRGDRLRLRLVGVRDSSTGEYHFYLTNLPAEEWTAEEVARLYSLRWEIELVFREMKGCYRLEHIPSGKRPVAEALIYASLLTLFASRHILAAVREHTGDTDRVPEERWGRLFFAAAVDILVIILDNPCHARSVARRLEPFLLREAVDPNRKRALLLDRVTMRAA